MQATRRHRSFPGTLGGMLEPSADIARIRRGGGQFAIHEADGVVPVEVKSL
jgi:hypothetical protein